MKPSRRNLDQVAEADAAVTAEDAALLVGLAPARDPRAVFDLRLRGTGELALSLKRAHTLFLDLKRAGVIEEDGE